jgi:hypothetical protein
MAQSRRRFSLCVGRLSAPSGLGCSAARISDFVSTESETARFAGNALVNDGREK